MCSKCQPLLECPVGRKCTVNVELPDKQEIVDYYGRKLFISPVQMHIDKWPDGQVDCLIGQDCHDENNVGYGSGVNISHCPFCGQRLR